MKASEKIKKFIKEFESLKLKAYLCPARVWTIGYGHTDEVFENQSITLAKAEELFEQDVYNKSEKYIQKYVKTELNQNQYDALVSFVFNIGSGNFYKSSVLKYLNKQDFTSASRSFMLFNKIKNELGELVVINGLTRRRNREIEIFNLPVEIQFRISANDVLAMRELQLLPYNNVSIPDELTLKRSV